MVRCPVSVIIPTFNRALLLGRAVESVLRQTVQCSELIIVDDGSTDDTLLLLEKLSNQAKCSVKVCSRENRGPAAARNLAITRAKFPFVAFLDSDDHWHRRKLEIQYQSMLHNPGYLISHTREKWLRRGQHLNQKLKHIPRHGHIFDHCLQLCAVGMSTVMAKKELFDRVGLFDENLPCCEDYDLWLRTSARYPFLLVEQALTVKEGGREDQLSVQHRKGMDKFRIYSIQKLLDDAGVTEQIYRMALIEFKKKVTIYSNGCLKRGKGDLGRSYLELLTVYEQMAIEKFHHRKECLDEEA